MPPTSNPPSSLDTALATLEDALESPVVPGELPEWTSRMKSAFEALRELYVNQTRRSHATQLAEIRDQDQEMSATVARLGEEDEAILVELERLGGLLQVFVEHIDPKAEGSGEAATDAESSFKDQRRSIVEEMLALVIRIRMHEKSLQTWFVEAFQRDRGVAD